MIVCYSVNNKYFDLFEVSLKSLFETNKVSKLYVIHSSLSVINTRNIESMCNNNCLVEFLKIDNNLFNDYEIGYLESEAYYRLLIPELIEENRAWYIDVDTLIMGSIQEAYDIDLNHMLAAVPKPLQNNLVMKKNILGMSQDAQYFNAGVLLLNLKRIRDFKFFNKVIDWIDNNIDIINMPDQDALNALLNDDYHKLDTRFNVTSEIVMMVENPLIIHFTGKYKPNLYFYNHPYMKLFKKHYSNSRRNVSLILNAKYVFRQYIVKPITKIPFIKLIIRKITHRIK